MFYGLSKYLYFYQFEFLAYLCDYTILRRQKTVNLSTVFYRYTSKFFTDLACVWMNFFLGSTSSPIKISKVLSVWWASSISTFNNKRLAGFIVVSQSCSESISPKPLYRCKLTLAMPF